MSLFRYKKQLSPHQIHPELYSKWYYITKQLGDGVEIVSKNERTNKKRAADLLMKAGPSSHMGATLTNCIEKERAARELNR